MRRAFLLSLPVIAALSLPALSFDVHDDLGGRLLEYARKYERAERPIRLFGHCASACTLALYYPSTCVGPRAVLSFHAVRGAGRHNRLLTQWMYLRYPPAIRSWIDEQGGLTEKLITLKGAELRQRVRGCK